MFGPQAAVNSSPQDVVWHRAPPSIPFWKVRYTWLRWMTGRFSYLVDRGIGRWASREIARLQPDLCYVFTQVGLETLLWAQKDKCARRPGQPERTHPQFSANLRGRVETLVLSGFFLGHPTLHMVQRVEREYDLAQRIRVSSSVGAALDDRGRCAGRQDCCDRPTNRSRALRLPAWRRKSRPPKVALRVCFVGSSGFAQGVYLSACGRFELSVSASRRITSHSG